MLFDRNFKVRTRVTLRKSTRRKLIENFAQELGISMEDRDVLFKDKVATEIKLNTFSRQDVLCYLFDDVPLFLLYANVIYPTVFLLSKVSLSNVPTIYTYDTVMERIYGGADLMLPGVVKDEPFDKSWSLLKKSSVCSVAAISVQDNEFKCSKPLAVGICEMSPAEAMSSGGGGKFVSILHSASDKLCGLCPPHLLPSFKLSDRVDLNYKEISPESNEDLLIEDPTVEKETSEISPNDLTKACFASALLRLKSADLPIPVNVFYAKYMKSSCADGQNLDIKKTSYKKVNEFLNKMAEEGFIELETVDVGIIHVVGFHTDHPRFMEMAQQMRHLIRIYASPGDVNVASPGSTQSRFVVEDFYFGPPTFEEVRIISSRVAAFFAFAGYKTNEVIKQSDICRIVGSYVDSKNLRCPENSSFINVDAWLTRFCEPNLLKEAPDHTMANPCFQITFQDLLSSLTKGLKVAQKVTFPPQSGRAPVVTSKSTIPKVKLYEVTQHGREITRVAGLGQFGVEPKAFARFIQTKLACSASLTEDPRAGNEKVVQIQGNHRIALSKLLLETFGFSKNWIDGYQEPSYKKKSGRK